MSYPASKGKFLTVEGIEGVGKSTAIKYIQTYLTEANLDCVVTREPGGTPIAEELRQILLKSQSEILTADTELLLMFACRAQHLSHVIRPSLERGKWVLCDRFVDASYAYQGGGRKVDIEHIKMLDAWIVNSVKPDITILLDAPPEVGLMRAKHRGPQDRIESEKLDFFKRVREIYLARAKKEPQRFRIIDATDSIENVQLKQKKILDELLETIT